MYLAFLFRHSIYENFFFFKQFNVKTKVDTLHRGAAAIASSTYNYHCNFTSYIKLTPLYQANPLPNNFSTLKKKTFENIVGNGENGGNQYFLLFQNVFDSV